MAWFRRKSPADETAEVLYRLIVEERQQLDDPGYYDVPAERWSSYKGKMRVYREALVLMTLLSKTENDSAYEPLLIAYERLLFPPTPTPESMVKLEALKGAMRTLAEVVELAPEREELTKRLTNANGDLEKLFDPSNGRWFRWSTAWMAGIGHDTASPHYAVPCMEFTMNWVDSYIHLRNAIDALKKNL